MSNGEIAQTSSQLSAWETLIEKHRPTPEQEASRELAFQHFVRHWTQDPWRAEQAAQNGEGWLRGCFNSAALAYAVSSDEASVTAPDPQSPDSGASKTSAC